MVGFFDIIQAYFTQITGRFVMFSGRDMELLRTWRTQGASPACICRGIREAVLNMQEDQPPRSIYNCRKFIIPHVERAGLLALDHAARQQAKPKFAPARKAEQQAASSPRKPPHMVEPVEVTSRRQTNAVLRQALHALERAGAQCEDESTRAIYREMWYRIRALTAKETSVEYQYDHLLHLEEALTESYFSALSLDEQKRIDAHLDELDKSLPVRMSPEAWRRHRISRRQRVLVQEYGLIKLIE